MNTKPTNWELEISIINDIGRIVGDELVVYMGKTENEAVKLIREDLQSRPVNPKEKRSYQVMATEIADIKIDGVPTYIYGDRGWFSLKI